VCRLAGDAYPEQLAHLRDFVVLTHGAIPGERLMARVHRVAKGVLADFSYLSRQTCIAWLWQRGQRLCTEALAVSSSC